MLLVKHINQVKSKSKNDCIYFLENKKLKEEIEALKKQLLTRMIS